jgi:urease accessory protein
MKNLKITLGTIAAVTLAATPAMAHHAMGGEMPTNFAQGLLSGVAHPVIGVDHLVMIVAIGLFAGIKRQGLALPIAFCVAAMAGTGFHLLSMSLPGAELWVTGSVLILGLLMLVQERLNLAAIFGLIGLAGLFHGYAYGESIFGVEGTPLVAYLIGFTAIQMAIGVGAAQVAKTMDLAKFRSAGFMVVGVGFALFVSQLIAIVLPV